MAAVIDDNQIGVEFDGPGVGVGTVDPIVTLGVAIAYLELLRAISLDRGHVLDFEGIDVRSGSAAVATRPSRVDDAIAASQVANDVVTKATRVSPRVRAKRDAYLEAVKLVPPGTSLTFLASGARAAMPRTLGDRRPGAWSVTSFRGTIQRVGGKDPRISFATRSEPKAFTLALPLELVEDAKQGLYEMVDIDCRIARLDGQIDDAIVTRIRLVPKPDGHDPWRDWFAPHAAAWDEEAESEDDLV